MARIDSNAKITKIEILSDYFSDKAPLNGAYLKGEKIGVRLTITGASWTIGKGSITIDDDGVFQITEGITNSGDKNSRTVSFEIDLQEFVK
jgi:hypothetical protein